MPETPYYLLLKHRKVAAMTSLKTLRRTSDVGKELEILESDVQRQQSEQGGFKELFMIPANRKAFMLVNVTRIFQQMTGISAFGAYFQLMISNAADVPPMLGVSMLLMLQMLVNLSMYYIIDLYGRKTLLMLSAVLTTAVLLALGAFLALRDFMNADIAGQNFLPIILIFLYIIGFNSGFSAIPNVLTAEMFSTSIKAKASALSSLTLSFWMMGTIKFYQFTADHISLAVPFLTFGITTLLSIFFFAFSLIETKGNSLESIQQKLIASG